MASKRFRNPATGATYARGDYLAHKQRFVVGRIESASQRGVRMRQWYVDEETNTAQSVGYVSVDWDGVLRNFDKMEPRRLRDALSEFAGAAVVRLED